MPLTKLQFRPGIVRETTDYTNEGGWFDCDKIRFRNGYPETIGGWTRYTSTPFVGTCRSLHNWAALDGDLLTGLGTNLKFYIVDGSAPADITPIRRTVTLGSDPIETVAAGSGVVIVSDVGHGALLNDYVTISGSTAVDGITTGELNKEHQITEIVDADSYKIDTGGSATSGSVSGGGAAVDAEHQINTGLDTAVFGTGWGADPWGSGGWGSPATTTIPGAQLRVWSQDNFGEDLVFCPRDGGIYYWSKSSGVAVRAVNISDLAGANSTPTVAKVVLVSERDRHVLAFGCDTEASPGVQDPLAIRFSSQENITDWQTRPDNTAGELRIGSGSEIIAAVQTKQQVFVLTDSSAHTVQYIGSPFTFGLSEVSTNTTVIGQNAAVAVGDAVYWMGVGEFYVYNGAVSQLPCDVKEYVFSDLNVDQALKVVCGTNNSFGEVWWFYPSASSQNVDRYVVYNYQQQIWYYGTLSRTCWLDRGVESIPVAASPDHALYFHEVGFDDGSVEPALPISAYIESSQMSLGEGDQFVFLRRLIPDLTFRDSTAASPTATFTLKTRNFPGGNYLQTNSKDVVKTASVPVEQFTDQVFVRLRGRSFAFRIDSEDLGVTWRLGSPRVEVQPDGMR